MVIVWLATALSWDIHKPWINFPDFNGAVWSQSAHNNLRAGLKTTLGVPTGFYFGPLPIPPNGYYTHHPPLLPLMVTGLFAVLGEREWVARLLPIMASALTIILLWLLVRHCIGVRAATFSAAIFSVLPMELRFGKMVNHESLVLMWILALLVALRHWTMTREARWLAVVFVCSFLGMWTGWHMYMFAVPLAGILIARGPGAERTLGYALVTSALLSIVLFFVLIRLARADAWHDLWNAFQFRLGSTDQNQRGYPWTQWFTVVGRALFLDIPPIAWGLAVLGAVVLWRNHARSEQNRWLGWAALGIFAMDAIYVVAFRNASFIHAYASFYFVAPIAMMSGVALDALIQGVENRSGNRPVPRAAVWWGVLAVIALLGTTGFTTTRRLDREQHCILDWKTHEPPDLVPQLGKAIRETFSEDTLVLCNFLPVYGPHLYYYAQRNLWNNLNAYAEWEPIIGDSQLRIGGVIWMGASNAQELLSALPEGTRQFVSFGDPRFCLWSPTFSK